MRVARLRVMAEGSKSHRTRALVHGARGIALDQKQKIASGCRIPRMFSRFQGSGACTHWFIYHIGPTAVRSRALALYKNGRPSWDEAAVWSRAFKGDLDGWSALLEPAIPQYEHVESKSEWASAPCVVRLYVAVTMLCPMRMLIPGSACLNVLKGGCIVAQGLFTRVTSHYPPGVNGIAYGTAAWTGIHGCLLLGVGCCASLVS